MSKSPSLLHLAIVCLILLPAAGIQAEESSPKWSISGFGSFGGIGTDTDAIGFYRDTMQTKAATKSWGVTTDSRLGLQLDIAFNEQFHITTQWIARDHAGNFFEQNLEWAFLRWSPRSDIDIRAGRLGIDIYLLSDYRDVGYAYPWMRPPHEFYAYLPAPHFDGLDISKRYSLGNGYLNLKLFAGYTHSAIRQSPTALNAPLVGANISYNSGNWHAKISYSYLHALNELAPEKDISALNDPGLNIVLQNVSDIASQLTTVNNHGHYTSIGGAYDDGVWLLQAEAAYVATNSLYFPSQASAYFSIGRRFSTVTLYTLYGVAQTLQDKVSIPEPSIPSPLLQQLHNTLDNLVNQNGTDEQSLSLGLRWDFYTNIAFKAQWSHYWLGTSRGIQQWENFHSEDTPNNVNVWSVGIDFIF